MVLIIFVFDGTRAFGYSSEDVQMVIETMAAQGKEPTFCMGDDIPLAILSQKPHTLYDYFKQRFAQVWYNLFHNTFFTIILSNYLHRFTSTYFTVWMNLYLAAFNLCQCYHFFTVLLL